LVASSAYENGAAQPDYPSGQIRFVPSSYVFCCDPAEFVDEPAATDSQLLGGERAVPVAFFQRGQDGRSLDLGEPVGVDVLLIGLGRAGGALGAGLPTPPIHALQVSSEPPAANRASQTWAMLIKRVYEIDPLACPKCGAEMKIVAFIEPLQGEVIEKILRHCGLWHSSAPRAPPASDASVHDPASSDEPRELTYVDIDTFEASLWADF